jgi:hypothetical protein
MTAAVTDKTLHSLKALPIALNEASMTHLPFVPPNLLLPVLRVVKTNLVPHLELRPRPINLVVVVGTIKPVVVAEVTKLVVVVAPTSLVVVVVTTSLVVVVVTMSLVVVAMTTPPVVVAEVAVVAEALRHPLPLLLVVLHQPPQVPLLHVKDHLQ